MPRHFSKKCTGLTWTKEEDQLLQEEINQNKTIRDISVSHKRTVGSILHRIYKLKIKKEQSIIPYSLQLSGESFEESFSPIVSTSTSNIVQKNHICIFDTETTGLPPYTSITKSELWPRMVQFACMIYDQEGTLVRTWSTFIKPDGFVIPEEVVKIHHITNEIANTGITIEEWSKELSTILQTVHTLVAHNMIFDNNIIQSELYRANQMELLQQVKRIRKECSMMMGKKYIMEQKIDSRLSLPILCRLLQIPVPSEDKLHNALVDTELCATLYFELVKKGVSNNRTDLVSLYTDKEILKHLGAKWDGGQKTWYIYDSDTFSYYVKKWFVR
jgi:DNA polymerase-3 subunit epsilon